MDPYTQQYEFAKVKKRRHMKLVVTYTLMTIAVVAISAVCIALVMGYRFDFLQNKVSQGALIQFVSQPANAYIVLDGQRLNFNTPGKRSVDAGAHTVKIQKEDYREWSKNFTLQPGEVRWLNYARLVPLDIQTRVVKEYPKMAQTLPSPDHDWIWVLPNADKPEFELVDIRNSQQLAYTTFTIADQFLTHEAGAMDNFQLSEWNFGSRYVLVKHTYGDKTEFIRLDRTDPENVVNLTTKFGVPIQDMHFSTENVFYGFDTGNLRKYDLNAGTLTDPIVKDVVSMKLYGDTDIAFVRHIDKRYRAGVIVDNKVTEVVDYDETLPLLIDLTTYYNNRYLAVARGNQLYVYQNPHRKEAGEMVKTTSQRHDGGDIKWLDISSVGRFVIAGTSRQFMTYDIELNETSRINLPGAPGDEAVSPQWLDESNLISVADNKLRMVDFNGDNQQVITNTLWNFPVTLNDDGKLLYSTDKNEAGVYQLRVSGMTIEDIDTTIGTGKPDPFANSTQPTN